MQDHGIWSDGKTLYHEEARALELLEFIVYAQMLKRGRFSEEEMKAIIKMSFEHYGGNYTYVRPD